MSKGSNRGDSLLFTDIEGSTRLLQQLGKRYSDVLAECRNLLRTTFQQWIGHEVGSLTYKSQNSSSLTLAPSIPI